MEQQLIIYLPSIIAISIAVILLFLLLKNKNQNAKLAADTAELTQNNNTLLSQVTELQQQVELLNQKSEQQAEKLNEWQSLAAKENAEKQGLETRLQDRNEQLEESKVHVLQLDSDKQRLMQTQAELSNELTQLKTTLTEKQANFEQQKRDIEEQKQQLKVEFSELANQILEEKGKSFSQSNKIELDSLLKPFKEQIDGFQKRVNEVHTESVKGQAGLSAELKKVLDIGVQMSDEANNLATALKGEKKTAGNWGEIQLERTLQLAGLVKGSHYETQDKYLDDEGNRRLPDFVIKLPDEKHIVIDSKVSLVAYDKAIAAESEAEVNLALDEHVGAVKNHIDDLHKKDYSNLVGMRSPSFVLMFMPIEPAYIEALKHKKDLFNYGYDKNVILVSHTTLMPILKTVANLWRIEQGNSEAREISERAGEIYNQVCVVAERLQKLGRTLSTVSNQYNDTVKGLAGKQGLAGKVERFSMLSNKVSKSMPQLEATHQDLEHERLELIAEKVEQPESDSQQDVL